MLAGRREARGQRQGWRESQEYRAPSPLRWSGRSNLRKIHSAAEIAAAPDHEVGELVLSRHDALLSRGRAIAIASILTASRGDATACWHSGYLIREFFAATVLATPPPTSSSLGRICHAAVAYDGFHATRSMAAFLGPRGCGGQPSSRGVAGGGRHRHSSAGLGTACGRRSPLLLGHRPATVPLPARREPQPR